MSTKMRISREEHFEFLEQELKTQTNKYLQLIQQKAIALLEKEELFTSQFLKFENGEMILKFKAEKSMPRKGEYLSAVLLLDEKRSYRSWGDLSWAELRKNYQHAFSEAVCVWHHRSFEEGYQIAGFRGVSLEFADNLLPKCLVSLGPKDPPLQYLQNLIKVVKETPAGEESSQYLDFELGDSEWQPSLLENKNDVAGFLQSQLNLADEVAVQGPPGTGKTFLMAELISRLLGQNKSILVTALTNRALIELASKPQLKQLLEQGKLVKCNLTKDEEQEVPGIKSAKELHCAPGMGTLATFYIASGAVKDMYAASPLYDYLIMDEASQALLGMFALSRKIARKIIFIGDPYQLSSVVLVNEDIVLKMNARPIVEGFRTVCSSLQIPSFQLNYSRRLPERAATYTGLFYQNSLRCKTTKERRFIFPELGQELNKFLHPKGGPTLLKSSFPVGEDAPAFGLFLISNLLMKLVEIEEKDLQIAVLTKTKRAVKAIQQIVYATLGTRRNLLIDTVERVQGMTCDVTIFFIPNSKINYALEKALFNVATSRATRHTLIIADEKVVNYSLANRQVSQYLQKLDQEFSFTVEEEKNMRKLEK